MFIKEMQLLTQRLFQLRYLQTLSTISAEHNSTIIFPMPINIFRWCHFLSPVRKMNFPSKNLISKSSRPFGVFAIHSWYICKFFWFVSASSWKRRFENGLQYNWINLEVIKTWNHLNLVLEGWLWVEIYPLSII